MRLRIEDADNWIAAGMGWTGHGVWIDDGCRRRQFLIKDAVVSVVWARAARSSSGQRERRG